MLYFFGRGHLGEDAQVKVENKTGKYYRIAVAFNRVVMSKNGLKETETIWGSGLLHEAKVKNQLQYLVKGAPVSFVTNKGWVRSYTQKDGTHVSQLDLGFIQSLEAGMKFPPKEEAATQQQQFVQQQMAAPQQQFQQQQPQFQQQQPQVTPQQGGGYPGAQQGALPF